METREPAILGLIRALAKYERLTPHLRLSARRLRRDGFGRRRGASSSLPVG